MNQIYKVEMNIYICDMIKKILIGLLILLSSFSFAQVRDSIESKDLDSINYTRLSLVTAIAASSFGVSYLVVLKKGWWSEPDHEFHFENDFEYAYNADKMGHFMGGYLIAEGFRDGLEWSGVNEFNGYIYSGILSSSVQIAIDVKDGYAKEWGYSIWDVGAGSLGAFFPMLQRYTPGFNYLDLKISYWRNSEAYWKASGATHLDDYMNQTYWVALDMHRLMGYKIWPKWMRPAIGASINGSTHVPADFGAEKSWELYFSLDWHLQGFYTPHNKTLKRFFWYIDRVKLPSPTLQFYPHWELHLAYPIVF
ncbi:YfiM family protein [Fibrobacterales bacterium]|nr:YfiM family protein [Fibrobacterales bacterium]